MEETVYIGSLVAWCAPKSCREKVWSSMDAIQLVETEVPIAGADNCADLAGIFLFQQKYKPCSASVECLFCRKKYPLMHRGGLDKHYYVRHGLTVVHEKAEFKENVLFIQLPCKPDEQTKLNAVCSHCDTILKDISEISSHYSSSHAKQVKFVTESELTGKDTYFYCSICGNASDDFQLHYQHMYSQHQLEACYCRYCMFCFSHSYEIYSHTVENHAHLETGLNFQCSACSVYLRGTDVLTRHLREHHAVQIGDMAWCCVKCLIPYGTHRDLLLHLPHCPHLDDYLEVRKLESIPVPHNDHCKCSDCALKYSLQQELQVPETKAEFPEQATGVNLREKVSCDSLASGEASTASSIQKEKCKHVEKTMALFYSSCHRDREASIVCGGCVVYFDSEEQFAKHVCHETAV